MSSENKENAPLDLLTSIPNFNIFSPSAYSQILSNVFFTVDLFFAQNIETTIKIKDYFTLISGHTPLKSRVDFYQNGTIKFLTQGGLLDIYYLNKEVPQSNLITEKAIKEKKIPFTRQSSVIMPHMAQDGNFRRRIVWCQTNDYTFNNLVVNFISKDEKQHNHYSAVLFFALRNQANKLTSLIVGSRGEGGKINVKQIETLTIPWISNSKIQEKLFNLLNNDLAKLIKEKQEQIKEKLLQVDIPNKKNDKN